MAQGSSLVARLGLCNPARPAEYLYGLRSWRCCSPTMLTNGMPTNSTGHRACVRPQVSPLGLAGGFGPRPSFGGQSSGGSQVALGHDLRSASQSSGTRAVSFSYIFFFKVCFESYSNHCPALPPRHSMGALRNVGSR